MEHRRGHLPGRPGRHRGRPSGAEEVGPAAAVVDVLKRSRLKVLTPNTREYATACQSLYDAIHEGPALAVRPSAVLDEAAAAVGRRPLGEGWAWARRASVPI